MTMRAVAPRVLLGLVIAGAALWLFANRERLDPELLQTAVEDLGRWAPLAHIALFALATLLFVPGALFGLAGGAFFGPLWGTALNLVGATMGATAAFLVGRYLAADWVRCRTGARLARLIAGVEAEGWRFVAFVRLVPLFPFNLVNYALGLTRISQRTTFLHRSSAWRPARWLTPGSATPAVRLPPAMRPPSATG